MRIGRESVAGRPESSSAGTTMCAVMIDSTPASIADSNGGRSMLSSSSRVWSITGRPVCESTLVSPWPGKCFEVEATSSRW